MNRKCLKNANERWLQQTVRYNGRVVRLNIQEGKWNAHPTVPNVVLAAKRLTATPNENKIRKNNTTHLSTILAAAGPFLRARRNNNSARSAQRKYA